jgi:hypothetical protein
MDIFDVSQIQHRYTLPQVTFVGGVHWADGSLTQATTPITYHGVPYVIAWDEEGQGGVRFIDISDARYPTIASHIRLAIDMPQYASTASADTANTGNFGYQTHYCTVDRQDDPTALACGWFQSGVRVFDIRDIFHPREIAYFNPPAQTGKNDLLVDSYHAAGANGVAEYSLTNGDELTADWCSSPPEFRGDELWVTCQDNGFMILKFAPGVYPISDSAPGGSGTESGSAGAGAAPVASGAPQTSSGGAAKQVSRKRRSCALSATISVVARARGRAKLRQVTVYVNGHRVKHLRTGKRVVRVKLSRPHRTRSVVRVVEVLSNGRKITSTRTFVGCA